MAIGSLTEQHLALIPLLYAVDDRARGALPAGDRRRRPRRPAARRSPRRHDGTAASAPGGAAGRPAPGRRRARRRSRLSATLSRYLGRQVLIGIGFALFGLALVALVVDTVELLRRAYGRPGVRFGAVLLMALLHLPFLLQKLMPFGVLFGTILTFQRLTRSHELVATRAAGVSVWQFLSPALLVAGGLGVLAVVAFNPLASVLVARYEALDHSCCRSRQPDLVAPGGLWLRQPDRGGGELLLHARKMNPETAELEQVVVFSFGPDARFASRIDAPRAYLRDGYWELVDPLISGADGSSRTEPQLELPTDLTATAHRGELRRARDAVVLGSAALHRGARGGRLLGARAPPLLAWPAGDAAAALGDAADRHDLEPAPGAARRHRPADRRRPRHRLRLLHHVRRGLRDRPVGPAAGDPGGLDPGRRRRAARPHHPAPSGGRLSVCRRLAAAAAALLLLAGVAGARAQEFRQGPVLLFADRLALDRAANVISAEGNVEVVHGGRRLLSDELRYDQDTDLIEAVGNVVLIEPTGEELYADRVVLSGDLGPAWSSSCARG